MDDHVQDQPFPVGCVAGAGNQLGVGGLGLKTAMVLGRKKGGVGGDGRKTAIADGCGNQMTVGCGNVSVGCGNCGVGAGFHKVGIVPIGAGRGAGWDQLFPQVFVGWDVGRDTGGVGEFTIAPQLVLLIPILMSIDAPLFAHTRTATVPDLYSPP